MYFIILVGKLEDDELDMNRITIGDESRDLREMYYTHHQWCNLELVLGWDINLYYGSYAPTTP